MGALLWLPDVLRRAGLTVHEVDGWRTRTSKAYRVDQADPRAIVCHATAGSRAASDADEIGVLLRGSSTAPAPIAQLYLGRTGAWWVVAAGVCNHIGDAPLPGTGVRGNRYAIGIEAANNNRDEPWPPAQYGSYVRGVAALCRHLGLPVERVYAHKEISTSGKTDPTYGMPGFRQAVARLLDDAPPTGGTNDMDMTQKVPTGTGRQITWASWLADMYISMSQTKAAAFAAQADAAAARTEVAALAELVRAGGGSADTAAVLDAIRAAGDRTRDQVLTALARSEQAQADALDVAGGGS